LTIIGFVAFFVVVILAPLLLFTPQPARAKREGLAEYGTLATTYVIDFDQKWMHGNPTNEQLLGSGDIQSLADLGNSFAVVREMRAVPFVTDDLGRLVASTVIPLVPLLLTNPAARTVNHPDPQDPLRMSSTVLYRVFSLEVGRCESW